MKSDRRLCGPFVCAFPRVQSARRGERWRCPRCGTLYRMTGRKRAWPWRNWSAPNGMWVLAHPWRGVLNR